MDASLKFRHTFTSLKNPDLQFEIVPLTKDDLEEAVSLSARCYSQRDPLVVHFQIPYEEIYISQKIYAQRAIEDNMAVVVKDTKTGKIIGVALQADEYHMNTDPVSYEGAIPSTSRIYDLMATEEYMEFPKNNVATQPNEIVHGVFIAVDEAYAGNRVQLNTQDFLIKEHPIISKARLFYTEVYNPISSKVCDQSNWKTVETLSLKTFKTKEGQNLFEGFEETMKKLGMPPSENMYIIAVAK